MTVNIIARQTSGPNKLNFFREPLGSMRVKFDIFFFKIEPIKKQNYWRLLFSFNYQYQAGSFPRRELFIFQGGGLETPLLHTFPTCVHPCNEIFYVCKIINYKNILFFSKIYNVFFQIAAGVLCYHLIRSIKRKAKSKEQQVFFLILLQIYLVKFMRHC